MTFQLPVRSVFLSLTGILATVACADVGAPSARTTIRDSAGVRIAETVLPPDGEAPTWRVDTVPSVVIGDGRSPDHELDRVGRVLRLTDGRIVVANGRPPELRVYDSSGAFLIRIGRAGDGPGEFRSIGALQQRSGDSLFVLDPAARRLSVFTSEGTYARSSTLAPQVGEDGRVRFSLFGLLDDGSVLAASSRFDPGEGIVIPTSSVARATPSLDSTTVIGTFPGDHMHWSPIRDGMATVSIPMFGRTTSYVVDGDELIVAHDDTWEIRRFDRTGKLRGIVRVAGAPRPLTDRDYDVVIDSMRAARPDTTAAARELWRQQISHYETLPAYSDVIVDSDHNLWVREYGRPGEDRSRWSVFDREGAFLAIAETPAKARVLTVGPDYVIVLARGAADEERVHLHRLTRSSRA